MGSQMANGTSRRQICKPVFEAERQDWKSLDYVAGWFMKAADYGTQTNAAVAHSWPQTQSAKAQQVPMLWPLIFATGHEIAFAHTSFKWANLASHNAGVTVVIVGISKQPEAAATDFYEDDRCGDRKSRCNHQRLSCCRHRTSSSSQREAPLMAVAEMDFGNMPNDGGHLILDCRRSDQLDSTKLRSSTVHPAVSSARRSSSTGLSDTAFGSKTTTAEAAQAFQRLRDAIRRVYANVG